MSRLKLNNDELAKIIYLKITINFCISMFENDFEKVKSASYIIHKKCFIREIKVFYKFFKITFKNLDNN